MRLLTTVTQSYHRCSVTHQPIYLACSGGRDSMALLFACHQLGVPIHVLHVNHRLQAPSDAWQKLVENFCQTHQIPCQSFVLSWQNPQTVNEAQARTARYQAFAGFVPAYAVIATAHHANDQAETLLINLCKGTGLAGLTGMAEISEQLEFGKPIQLWRPLLAINREEISEFIAHYHIPYVDDPTNHTGDNQRAFLRTQILPLLNQRFGNVIDNINRTRRNLADTKTIADTQTQCNLQQCLLRATPEYSQLDIVKLTVLSQAHRFAVLHRWVKGEQKFAPNRQLIEAIEQLIVSQNPNQQAVLYWQSIEIRRYRNRLYRLTRDYFAKQQQIIKNLEQNFNLRPVLPNEKLQLVGQSFHQTFKKICQAHAIPSWQRPFARILQVDDWQNLALILPSQIIWLAQSECLTVSDKQHITEKFEYFWQI